MASMQYATQNVVQAYLKALASIFELLITPLALESLGIPIAK
jgi:hypothetical protein